MGGRDGRLVGLILRRNISGFRMLRGVQVGWVRSLMLFGEMAMATGLEMGMDWDRDQVIGRKGGIRL